MMQGASCAKNEPFYISPENAVSASQREAAIVTKEGKYTVAGTTGAGPCYIIGMYSEGTAAVFHLDGSEDFSLLSMTAYEMHKVSHSPIQMHLRGGQDLDGLSKIFDELFPFLKDGSIKLCSAEIMKGKTASFAIDAKTGKTSEVSWRQMDDSLEKTKMEISELYMQNQPIRIVYDGRMEREGKPYKPKSFFAKGMKKPHP